MVMKGKQECHFKNPPGRILTFLFLTQIESRRKHARHELISVELCIQHAFSESFVYCVGGDVKSRKEIDNANAIIY